MLSTPFDITDAVNGATIIGAIVACATAFPTFVTYLKKLLGKFATLTVQEKSYLESLLKELERQNKRNRWSSNLYVKTHSEIIPKKAHDINPAFLSSNQLTTMFKGMTSLTYPTLKRLKVRQVNPTHHSKRL